MVNKTYLVIKVPMESNLIHTFLNDEYAMGDMECRISRELSGDDNEYEGMLFSEEIVSGGSE